MDHPADPAVDRVDLGPVGMSDHYRDKEPPFPAAVGSADAGAGGAVAAHAAADHRVPRCCIPVDATTAGQL